jgi:hypothetical protein
MFVATTNTIKQNSAGDGVNPTTATVLATMGANLPAGRYIVWVTLETTANAMFDIQHRNSTDAGNIEVAQMRCPANDSRQGYFAFVLDANERVRVVPSANITGNAGATINWQRIS